MIDFDKIKQHIKKEAERFRQRKQAEIMQELLTEAKDIFRSGETMEAFENIQSNQNFKEMELATPTEIAANIRADGNVIVINLRDERVNRTFRMLELYGNSPYQKFKDKLVAMGAIKVHELR